MGKPAYAPDPRRRALLAKIHIAKKGLGLSDADYRTILHELFGVGSSGDLAIHQMAELLNHFIARGWTSGGTSRAPAKPARGRAWIDIPDSDPHHRQKRKILAMARDMGWSLDGLNKRVERQFGVSDIRWLANQDDLQVLVKDMINRMGRKGVDPYPER